MRFALSMFATLTLVLTAGCGGEDDAPRVTWHEDVAPIVHARCTTCHVSGGIAPFSLETYEGAAAVSGLMVTNVESGRMPPWSAVSTDDCAPRLGFQDDPRLTPAEIETLKAWHEEGAPEGDK